MYKMDRKITKNIHYFNLQELSKQYDIILQPSKNDSGIRIKSLFES